METQDLLKLALVQTDIYWEDIPANLAELEEKLDRLKNEADIIILPEMFSTGFSMRPEKISEPLNLVTTRWMKQMALATGALVIGSFAAREGSTYYNRLMAVFPDGTYGHYDKRHLFRMGKEHEVYTAGTRKLLLTWKGWRICPLICYDLRFPVWSRNLSDAPYDLLIYVANWPAARSDAWKTLLKARAIENLSYVAGVNRTGDDSSGVAHDGGSAVFDFAGRQLLLLDSKPETAVVTISRQKLSEFHTRFPAHLDADSFSITGTDFTVTR